MTDTIKYTRQTIEMDNGILVDIDSDGSIEFYKEEGDDNHKTLLNVTAEEFNRVNRIIYSGRIIPEGMEPREPQRNFYPSQRRR